MTNNQKEKLTSNKFIQDILEQMQYEGCFIFRFKQGDFTKPQYIHIKDSPSADVTLSKNDILNFVKQDLKNGDYLMIKGSNSTGLHSVASKIKKGLFNAI